VGCVIVPIIGLSGVGGWVLIVTPAEATEVHPSLFVTVNVYVLAVRLEIVILVPEPLNFTTSG
jgi:hypothetical protein